MHSHETGIQPHCPWHNMYETFGPANVKWCEERICAIINEPLNTWTNLPYMLVGLFILFLGFKQTDRFKKAFGIIVFIMGFASFTYHATNNYLSQIFDFIGMYFYVYFLLSISLFSLKKINAKQSIIFFTVLTLVSIVLIPLSKYIRFPYQMIVLAAAISILVSQALLKRKMGNAYPLKYLVGTLSFFGIGAVFSYMDAARILCEPTHPYFQGHALWHLLGSIGVYFSYLLFTELKLKSGNYIR